MALQAVCHKCGSLSRGVSPRCENKLCVNFGQPARAEFEPADSEPPLPHAFDRKQFTLRTLVIVTTVVAGAIALVVQIPVLGFLLLACAASYAFLVFFIRSSLRWSEWFAAHPSLKLFASVLTSCLYLLIAITIAAQAITRASYVSGFIAAAVLLAAIAEGWRAAATYSTGRRT